MRYELTVVSVVSRNWVASRKVRICQEVLKKQGFDTYLEVAKRWHGWRSKITFNTEVVKKIDTEYIMFLDAADVIALAGPDEVMERYFNIGHPWVYCTEKNIWPPDSFEETDYPPSESSYRFVNSGGYIGKREYIFERYREWTNNWTARYDSYRSEQLWVAEHFLSNPGAIKLDTQCDIFLSTCDSDHSITSDGKVYVPETDTYPLMIHYNGGRDISKVSKAKKLWSNIL